MKTRSRPSNLSRFFRCHPTTDDDDDDDSPPMSTSSATTFSDNSPYTMSPYNPSTTSSPFIRSPWIHSTAAIAPIPPESSTTLLGSLIRQDGHVYSLAVSGDLLFTGSDSKNIRVWKNLREFGGFKSCSGLVKSIVIFNNKVFTGHQDGKIRVWKFNAKSDDYKRVGTLPRFKDFLKSSIKPSNYVEVRRHRNAVWLRHFDAVSCLALNAEQGLLYSGSWDRTIKVWRLSDFKCLTSVNAHDDAVNAVATAFGNMVISGSADGTVNVWEREDRTGKHVAVRTLLRKESAVTAIAVAEKDGVVYCGASDGWVRFWVGGRRMEKGGGLRWHSMAVLSLGAVGTMLVSGSADRTVRVWRREGLGAQHVRVAVLTGHTGPVKCLALQEDVEGGGEVGDKRWLLYSGSLDGSVRVWRLAERPPPGMVGRINCV
ncbi:protein JINGUBANG-like [Phalaenopsis equestris]|uniref:protein JINGUBANG-like n=1 Tax=Phalaenopsis equestris TaxID=78828 RepID=UPI0009E3E0BE|nr:protein JINGUBANG-like [Phalaenopsis equestris]